MVKLKGSLGFSLVESLVAITIFAIIGLIAVDILTRTFQGSNKTQLITKIKYNGQTATSTIEETMRGASTVICSGNGPSDSNTDSLDSNPSTKNTVVVFSDNVYTRIRFYMQKSINPLANGYIALDNPPPPASTSNFPALCDTDLQSFGKVILTDRDMLTGTSVVGTGGFIVEQSTGGKDIVTIMFNLGPPRNASSRFDATIDPVAFQTTVTLR